MCFSNKLQSIRKEKELSQEDLADMLKFNSLIGIGEHIGKGIYYLSH